MFINCFVSYAVTTLIYTLSLHDALPIFEGAPVAVRSGLDPRPCVSGARDHAEGGRVARAGRGGAGTDRRRSEEHTSELQSQSNLVCRLLLEKKKIRYRMSLTFSFCNIIP